MSESESDPAAPAGPVNHGALEREVKLAVDSLDPVEARLRALGEGAVFLGVEHERNDVLDTARGMRQDSESGVVGSQRVRYPTPFIVVS